YGGRLLKAQGGALELRDLLDAGCPLSVESSEALAREMARHLLPRPDRKKVLVIDLDGTCWHGIIGEEGPGGVYCAPAGPGAAFHVFQKFLLKLKNEGVLLAFCSKNNESDVLPMFDELAMP